MSEAVDSAAPAIASDAISDRHAVQLVMLPQAEVTPEFAQLTRAIGRGCEIALPELGEDAVLQLSLPEDDEEIDLADTVVLSGGGTTIEISNGMRLIRLLTGIDLGGELHADNERWSWMQAAVAGRLKATPLSYVERIARSILTGMGEVHALRLSLSTGQHTFSTYARASSTSWLRLLEGGAWKQKHAALTDVLHLRQDLPIRIARHSLDAETLHTLEAGDIIIPDTCKFECSGEGVVQIGNVIARVRYQPPCSLEILTKEKQLESSELGYGAEHQDIHEMDYERPNRLDEGGNTGALDGVPVTLDFVLGNARMSLGDMRTLGPGVIVSLSGGSPASIAIASAGHVLGRGEAVSIQGQLGIRITQWKPAQ